MAMKNDRKPCFQGLHAGLVSKALAAALAVAALQLTVCAAEPVKPDFPAGVPSDAVWLEEPGDNGNSYNSLTTDASGFRWSDGAAITADDTDKVYFIPAGLTARVSEDTQTVVPIVYCAGRIYPRAFSNDKTTFNDLRLLDGGYIDHMQIGLKAGNITVLATDPDNPAMLVYDRTEIYSASVRTFRSKARFSGSETSQLLYRAADGEIGGKNNGKDYLDLLDGSDWSEFYGTLRVADGLGISSREGVPISMPGTVKFGSGCILNMEKASAPYEFGGLYFADGGAITNTGSGSTLTVSGTFDTGTNCNWRSANAGVFGTLVLGDGLTLCDEQSTPPTVLTVTNRLVVGTNITIEYPNVKTTGINSEAEKVLLMKLSPEAVAAGVPDLSGVAVAFQCTWATSAVGHLATEEDPDVSGGLLVYATHPKFVAYTGPKSAQTGDNAGNWLDPSRASGVWDNNSYPDGNYIYYIRNDYGVAFLEDVPVFPGKMLLNRGTIRLTHSANYYVTNFYLYPSGSTPAIYARSDETHLGGNMMTIKNDSVGVEREIWQISSRSFYLDSILHGTGGLVFNSYYPDGEGSPFYLTADNSDWTGTLQLKWTDRGVGNYPSSESRHTRIVVGDAKSLGGSPAAFTHDLILLDDYAEIRFTNTTVQTASNRGLCVTNGILRVDEGATAALTAPVTLAGTLRKTGAGTLALGGGIRYAANDDLTDATAPEADKNIVLVQEGTIKGSSLAQAAVTFSDGTGIAADTASGAMDLTGATVTVEGTIYLKADGNTLPEPTQNVTYPIVKVSAAQAAELGDKFKAARSPWRGWPVTLVSETDADGNVTYSVKYEKKGFVMSIR